MNQQLPQRERRPRLSAWRRSRPRIELLEDRCLLAAVNWISTQSGNWNIPSNWSTGKVPGANDDVVINVSGASPVVTINSGAQAVHSLQCSDALSITGASLTMAANSEIDGTLTLDAGAGLETSRALTLTGSDIWAGGTLGGTGSVTLTSNGSIAVSGNTASTLTTSLNNAGTIAISGAGGLNVPGTLTNQAGGTLELTSGAGIGGGLGTGILNNLGTIEESAPSGTTSVLQITFNNQGGTIDVQSGTLAFAVGGTSTGGTFQVAQGATLRLDGGDGSIGTLTGTYTGSGQGTISLDNHTVTIGSAGATFDFPPGLFDWTGGGFNFAAAGTTLSNTGAITIDGTGGPPALAGGGTLSNRGTITVSGTAGFSVPGALTNQAGGTLELTSGAGIGGGLGTGILNNLGTVEESAPSGTTSVLQITFNNQGGTIDVQSGTLAVAGGGTSTGATFQVAQGATLRLDGGDGSIGTLTGTYTGSGQGTISLDNHTVTIGSAGATFDFPPGLFDWTGGGFNFAAAGTTLSNTGAIEVDGTDVPGFAGGGTLSNSGTITVSGNGEFRAIGTLTNQAGGTVNLTSAAGIIPGTQGGTFNNAGTLEESAPSGASTALVVPFNNLLGTIDVQSGALALEGGGMSTGGTFQVAQGATLRLDGGDGSIGILTGTYTGSGQGTISLDSHAVTIGSAGAIFDFPPGLFDWSGGGFNFAAAGTTLSNTGAIAIDGTDVPGFAGGGTLSNSGTITISGSGAFAVLGTLTNQAGGTVNLTSAAGINQGTQGGTFNNAGTLVDSAPGTTATSMDVNFNNQSSGTVDVESGTLAFAGGTSANNGGTFTVASNAALNLSDIAQFVGGTLNVAAQATVSLPSSSYSGTISLDVAAQATVNLPHATYSGTLDGSGGGTVTFDFGDMNVGIGGLTLNFPGNMFQWTGHFLNTAIGGVTNLGTINIPGPVDLVVVDDGTLDNFGTIVQTGTGNLGLHSDNNFPTTFKNEAGAFYLLGSDSGIDNTDGGQVAVINAGVIKKTGGSGTSTLLVPGPLTNTGTIEVDSGTLNVAANAVTQVSGNTLTGGTWTATGGASLTFRNAPNITTNAGNITLGGLGATIAGIAKLAASSGSFSVVDGATFATVGGLSNTGTLTLGPASTLSVHGIFTQSSSATLDVQLGGNPASGQFGQLAATAAASLDGTLQADIVGNYQPRIADQFTVLTYPSEAGNFAAFKLPATAALTFLATMNTDNVVLSAIVAKSDLALASIDMVTPESATAGENMSVTYTVINNGGATPVSSWTDSAYLTTGTTLDASAVLIGRATHNGSLRTNGSYQGTIVGTIPGVWPGNYHVIVVIDSRDQVPDTNRENNVLASPGVVQTGITALAIGGSLIGTIADGQEDYFRVNVPPGQDVVLTAQYATPLEAELETRVASLPDPASFDQNVLNLSNTDPQLTLSGSPGGAFYVLLDGREGSGAGQSFTLTAQVAQFTLESIGMDHGSDNGTVTVSLVGTEFQVGMQARLTGAGNSVIQARSVVVVDPTEAFATFDLSGAPVGAYNVSVTEQGATQTLREAFHVTVGAAGQLESQLVVPSAIRAGRSFTAYVEYQNTGDTDLTAPIFIVFAGGAADLSAASEAPTSGSLILVGVSSTGPAGILAPGEKGSIPFTVQPTTSDTISIALASKLASSTDLIPFSEVEKEVLPSDETVAQFDPTFQQVAAETGPTWGGFVTLMASTATELGLQGSGQGNGSQFSGADVFAKVISDIENRGIGSVNGTLFLNNNTHPLADAMLELATEDGSQGDATVTFNDGTFTFPPLPAGTYNLTVSGYLLASPVTVVVPATDSVSGLDLTVESGGAISGSIQHSGTGLVLSSVTVTASSDQNTTYTTESAADGSYRLTGLPAGTYTVTAGGQTFDTLTSAPQAVAAAQTVIGVDFTLDDAATFQGTVVQAGNGSPVASATVLLEDSNGVPFSATTDSTGGYTIGNLHPGTYSITVEADGFAAAVPAAITLSAGATTSAPTTSLLLAASVSVTVQDASAAPIASAGVELLQNGSQVAAGETDANGQITLSNVAAGTYTVHTTALGFIDSTATVVLNSGDVAAQAVTLQPAGIIQGVVTDGSGTALANVPVGLIDADGSQLTTTTAADGTYKFSSLSLDRYALAVGILPGLERHDVVLSSTLPMATVDFTLAGATVTGSVVAADGTTPAQNVTVFLTDGINLLISEQTNANGQYAFEGVAAGTYSVQTGGQTSLAASPSFSVAGANVAVPTIQPGSVQLTGNVVDPGGDPVAGAAVVVLPAALPFLAVGITATTAADGTFSVPGLEPGSYEVLVLQPGFATLDQMITLSAAAAPLSVQLQVGTTLSGTITDANNSPVAGASVTVVSEASHDQVAVVQTDANGSYQVANIAPGSYDLISSATGDAIGEVFGVAVAGSVVAQNVQLPAPSTTLQGSITDASGNPIAGATVGIADAEGNVVLSLLTDFSGQYSTNQLPAATFTIGVSGDGYRPAISSAVVLQSGQTKSGVNLVLASVGVDDLASAALQFRDAVDTGLGHIIARNLLANIDPANELKPLQIDGSGGVAPYAELQHQVNVDTLAGKQCEAEVAAFKKLVDLDNAMHRDFTTYQNDFDSAAKNIGNATTTLLSDAAVALSALVPGGTIAAEIADASKATANARDLANFIANIGSVMLSLDGAMQDAVGKLQNPGATIDTAFVTAAISDLVNALSPAFAIASGSSATSALAKIRDQKGALSKFVNAIPALGTALTIIGNILDFATAALNYNNDTKQVTADKKKYDNDVDAYLAAYRALLEAIKDCLKKHHNRPPVAPLPPAPPGSIAKVKQKLSHDPNELIGPAGVGPSNFVPGGELLPYTIDFTNEPTATAPAQIVVITEQLSSNLDFSAFQLGDFGFGSIVVNVPPGLSSYSTRVDATASAGVFVDVNANVNLQTGLVTWTFTSIDPTTLDVPTGNQSLEGFLPPDKSAPQGEGFVSYTIAPKAGATTGTVINAQATVVFDTNNAINTPSISNTIDANVPTSSVAPLPATTTSRKFNVSWSGSDGAGSGIARYDVFVSTNGGPFVPFQVATSASSAIFTGKVGNTYAFFSVATSNVGNTQPTPTKPQATVKVVAAPLVTVKSVRVEKVKVGKGKTAKTETVLVLQFSGPLNAASAHNVRAYGLAPIITVPAHGTGKNRHPATTKLGTFVTPATAVYNPTTHRVTLTPRGTLNLTEPEELIVRGGLLADSLGRPIDGSDDGKPGSNFVATIKGNRATTGGMPLVRTQKQSDAVSIAIDSLLARGEPGRMLELVAGRHRLTLPATEKIIDAVRGKS
jgi:protocatechuate 3,4-dioxygenase beta subunit